jgi:hypothetical protein
MYKSLLNQLKGINSMDIEEVINTIEELTEVKNDITKTLINVLEETTDPKIRKKAVLSLVDNFKDERIIPALINLIKRPDLEKNNAILVYALGEYSDCKEHLLFLIDLILDFDFHVAWNAYNIILSMSPPFDEAVIKDLMKRIEDALGKNEEKEVLLNDLILFFKSIIEE